MRIQFWLVIATCLAMLGVMSGQNAPGSASQSPKIRTVTAFVRLDPHSYREQVTEALKLLRAARSEFNSAGYEVETIRITSQPFPEIVQGMSQAQALAFFREYDGIAEKEG